MTAIAEESSAVIEALAAVIEPVPLPSTYAFTLVAILFCAKTPAPLTPMPVEPPPETAAAPATTIASMVWIAIAETVSAPVALMLEFFTNACSSAESDTNPSCFQTL